jgi:hypothetical protein
MKDELKNIILLVLFILLQVIWFNHILLFGRYTPVIFIYPVLLLPLDKNETFYLFFAFVLGITIDLLSNTGGVFAATAVAIAYFRKIYFIIIKNPSQNLESMQINKLGNLQRSLYYFIFIFISQLLMYLLESFNFSLMINKLGLIAVNTIITLFIFLILDLFVINNSGQ